MNKLRILSVLLMSGFMVLMFVFVMAEQSEKVAAKHPLKIKGSLHVTPAVFKGKCPKMFKFNGTITVMGVKEPVTIKYKFTRSDNATGVTP